MSRLHNSHVGLWQQRFVAEVIRALLAHLGRANFTNLARFSHLHEHTFRRHFGRFFDWVSFNLVLLRLTLHPKETQIAVFDTSFLPKSGKRTYDLDKFFSHAAKTTRTGLEVSLLGVIGVESRRTVAVDATQTPPGLSKRPDDQKYSRVDFYLEQLTDLLPRLCAIRYYIGDGYYAKRKIFNTLTAGGKQVVTKLRSDANLRFVIAPERRRGRYGGKVLFSRFDHSHFENVGVLDDLPHIRQYTAHVNSEHFRRDLRLVVLVNERDGSYLVLCSTDVAQPAEQVVRYYRLRYQLEFVFRDAKQHVGLSQCQARDQHRIDFHLNAVVAAVNVGRLVGEHLGLSLASVSRQLYHSFVVESAWCELRPRAELELSEAGVMRVLRLGEIRWKPD
ncbi:MAG: transposase [Rhodothermales bacterium]